MAIKVKGVRAAAKPAKNGITGQNDGKTNNPKLQRLRGRTARSGNRTGAGGAR
jgi:hypothetical protein